VAEHERCKLDCRSGAAARPFGGATLLQLGRTGAADQRNLGDSEGQRGTANLEVIGRLAAFTWAAKRLERAFTRQSPYGSVSACDITIALDLPAILRC
jgi:hypothetical protein